MRSLPDRVLGHLAEHGADYGLHIAEALGVVRSSAVAGALSSLLRRGLVTVERTEPAGGGTPRRYYALAAAPMFDVGSASDTPPREHPEGDLLERLSRELALLQVEQRVAGGDHEMLALLMEHNSGVRGL